MCFCFFGPFFSFTGTTDFSPIDFGSWNFVLIGILFADEFEEFARSSSQSQAGGLEHDEFPGVIYLMRKLTIACSDLPSTTALRSGVISWVIFQEVQFSRVA